MKTLGLVVFCCVLFASTSPLDAQPADFTGKYRILQSRNLALTFSHDFAIQDGSLVALSTINGDRPWCRSVQAGFDDLAGAMTVTFATAPDASETALLKSIPTIPSHAPVRITCIARHGFSGALDLSVALGRVVEFGR